MKNINNYVSFIITTSEIQLKDKKAFKCLSDYIENIIFNITSICAIIAFINHSKIITNRNIEIVSNYLKETCGTKHLIRGGNSIVLPSEFYGTDSNNYSSMNNTSDVLNIDFNSGVLRPQIGGAQKVENPIPSEIKRVINNYKLKITDELCKKLSKIIENYIRCLIDKFKRNRMNSTTEIKRIIASSKLFNIFK